MKIDLRQKRTANLTDQLHDQLLDRIISGEFKEGDKIPSENELCKSFEVSRPVVRAAIQRLQEEDLVKTKKGSGTYVLHTPLKNLGQFATANDVAIILQSHEVRIALEGEAASLAARRRSDTQLDEIKEAMRTMKKDFEARQLSIHADYKFHIGIAKATNNDIFVQLLENIHIGLTKTMAIAQRLSREKVKIKTSSDRNKKVLEEHQRILEAIELQDPEEARLAMRDHISKIKERIINRAQ